MTEGEIITLSWKVEGRKREEGGGGGRKGREKGIGIQS